MKTTTIATLQQASNNQDEKTYKTDDFIQFLQKEGGTINLYKNRYTEFVLQFMNKSNKLDYASIGLCFTGLMLYANKPTISDEELKKELNTKNELITKIRELIDIYNKSMLTPYKKSINGKKGRAPTSNKNAKKNN